jgi:ABC-2 type transport system permease protein
MNAGIRRLTALCRKETLQILRDPSSNLIAFVLPVVMLFIFGYGISLDSTALRIGLVLEGSGPEARNFAESLCGSPFLAVRGTHSQAEAARWLEQGRVRGFVVVPEDFDRVLQRAGATAPLLVVTDGAEPNTANFVENYARAAWEGWRQHRAAETGRPPPPAIAIEPRYWFNPSAESRNYLVPGSITVIMTVIGALLTSLVVAREWERGTMEQLIATPVRVPELVLGKLIPYFAIGLIDVALATVVGTRVFGVPFRGSLALFFALTVIFILGALSLGILISIRAKSQILASQIAMVATFLPAFLLSGFVFDIGNMPGWLQVITHAVPARYFVTILKGIFLKGTGIREMAFEALFLGLFGAIVTAAALRSFRKRLE